MKRPLIFILLCLLSCQSCNNHASEDKRDKKYNSPGSSSLEYAKKFTLEKEEDYTVLKVNTPWQNGSETFFEYLLAGKNVTLPDSLLVKNIIRTPLERVIIMSTTFASFIDTLDELNAIKGVSGSEFIYNQQLRSEIEAGLIHDVGFDHALNYELIVDMEPDAVFMFGVQAGIVQTINRLEEIGVPVIICADYLEPHPLGRCEWIKFFSAFFEKENIANSIFDGIAARYNEMTVVADVNERRPSVMLGLPWKDTWYIPGGGSFAAKFIVDAGGNYIYYDHLNSEAEPVNIESVFSRALEADYWLNPGVANNLAVILAHDPRFAKLKSFQNGNVFNNNRRVSPGGGNDYWESGIIHPEVILEDLIHIFHDSIINQKDLKYYFKLE